MQSRLITLLALALRPLHTSKMSCFLHFACSYTGESSETQFDVSQDEANLAAMPVRVRLKCSLRAVSHFALLL